MQWKVTGIKKCTVCKNSKPLEAFTLDKKRKGYPAARCKDCCVLLFRKNRYGVTPAEYERMLAEQNGCCAICGSSEPRRGNDDKRNNFCVDHCHTSGRIRGLLCHPCNRGLGQFKDSEDLLLRGILYLRRQPLSSKS